MDFYSLTLLLGGAGLAAMALSGIGRHGAGSHSGAAGHSHGSAGGHGHADGGGHGHSHTSSGGQTLGHVTHAGHAQSHAADGGHTHGPDQSAHATGQHPASQAILALMSPRVLFSLCLGVGTTGLLLRPVFGGLPLFLAAIAGGALFERVLVTPIWNFTLRFASRPAETLEHTIATEATAVTTFDANGQGIVALEMDGQVRQVLGTLQSADRQLGGRVHAGEKVRIEDIDPKRNRCTVSIL